jgi:putative peptidoglycan lipid II flippase
MAAMAIIYLSAGLLCFAWVKVAVAGFYSVKDTRTPVIVAFFSMLMNIVFIFILTGPFDMGFRGLALATTLSYSINFAALYVLLCRRFGRLWDAAFIGAILRIAVMGVMTGLVFYFVNDVLYSAIGGRGIVLRAVSVGLTLSIGGGFYMLGCALLRVPDVRLFASILSRAK